MNGTRNPAIMLRDLRKSYGQVIALDGAEPGRAARKHYRPARPERVGEDDHGQHPVHGAAARRWPGAVAGLDVTTHPAEVRRLIGFAGQFAAVDPNLTGRENLRLIGRLSRLPRPVARERTDEALERFGLAEAAGRLVRGYSGGMRRRLDVAAAPHAPPTGACFSTSRRPAWIRRPARSCGCWSPSWPRTGRRCC